MAAGPMERARSPPKVEESILRALSASAGTASAGLQLSLWPIFRPAHPPLFIPWTDIETEPVHGVFVESIRFSFRRANTFLLLRRELGEEILRMAGVTSPAWRISPPRSLSSTR